MSGGHWGSEPFLISQGLDNIGEDEYTKESFPELSKILIKMADAFYETLHALDYDISSDRLIKDKKEYQDYAIKLLSKALEGGKDVSK